MDQNKKKIGYDMLNLCKSVLLGTKTEPEYIEKTDMDSLFEFCQYHCLTSMVCTALELSGIKPDNKWEEAKAKSIRKNMLLDVERRQIFQELENRHIWHMALKGVYLKDLYPKIGMRQMADNDVLYDKSKQNEVYKIFDDRGYIAECVGKTHHDVYFKEPVYNFEMHTALVSENNPTYKYYENVKDRLILVDGKKYEYNFSDDDYYIFMTVHAYRHYSEGGTGLRTLIDYYIYLKNKESTLDWRYIEGELEKFSMSEFEQQIRITAKKVFSEESELTENEREMLEFMLFSGTYGNIENEIKWRAQFLNTYSKRKYLFRRIFPNMQFYRRDYPTAAKYPILIPFVWVFRLVRAVLTRRELYKAEINNIRKLSEKEFYIR